MAEIHGLEIPKWGMTMDEGTVTEWLVSEGAQVSKGDPVVAVESSKLSGEIEAPADGVLRRIVAQAGETLPVGASVGVVAGQDVPDEEIDAFLGGGDSVPAAGKDSGSGDGAVGAADPEKVPADQSGDQADGSDGSGRTADAGDAGSKDAEDAQARRQQATAHDGVAQTPSPQADAAATSATPDGPDTDRGADRIPADLQGTAAEEVPATPHAKKLAERAGIDLSKVEATGRGDRVTVADLQRAVAEAGGHLSFGNDRPRVGTLPETRDDSEIPATPIARRLAAEHGINLHSARPTGRAGRVTRADVLALVRPEAPAPTAEASAPAAPVAETNPATEVPMSRMRTVIGQRLQDSYQESPHFRVTGTARIDRLLQLRKEINDARLDVRLTVNDLVTKAVAAALVKVPEVNAQFDPRTQTITRYAHADVSVAVATEEGLITPIVRAADTKSLTELSAEITDLGTRAKAGQLKPEEFQGGTFTISNLGMYGVAQFDAIINPPQVAILAVAGATKQFVPDEHGDPVAATVLPVTLSADHRVVDGALAARFVRELTTLLETPALIFA